MKRLLKGEKVVCIINTRAEEYLTIGKEYELQYDQGRYSYSGNAEDDEIDEDDIYSGEITVLDDARDEMQFHKIRFLSVGEYRKLKIDNIIQ